MNKTSSEPVVGVLIFLFSLSTAEAQITIAHDEYPTTMGWSAEYFSGGPFDFLFPRPGVSPWNYSTGPTDETETRTVVPKTEGSYSDSFPGADFAIRTVYLTSSDTQYAYLSKTPSALFYHGFTENTGGDSFLFLFDDPLISLEFPLDMSDTWSDTISYYFFGVPLTQVFQFEVVTFGDLTVPAFSSLPCLVVRTQNIATFSGISDTNWSYSWLVENWGSGAGTFSDSNNPNFTVATSFERLNAQVGIEETFPDEVHSSRPLLFQNFPNPFSTMTLVRYSLPERGKVYLKIFDLTGRIVRTLLDHEGSPGMNTVEWDSKDELGQEVSNGVYFYRLHVGENDNSPMFTQTRKLAVLR